jgi:hypothetical protein
MATRAIVTHQPEVACDVCGRRLLRGERPDAFLDAGTRRIVCELCIPRAVGSGWTRESEALAAAAAAGSRGRQGRSLIGRLRQRRQAEQELEPGGEELVSGDREPFDVDADRDPYEEAYAGAAEGLPADADAAAYGLPLAGEHRDAGDAAGRDEGGRDAGEHGPASGGRAPAGSQRVEAAALVEFNGSEAAARIAGIARALGEPSVTVRMLGDGGERVSIVVAWELCWYRYEVDVAAERPLVSLTGEGMELDELPDEDRLGNARANERGELSLIA